MKRYFFKTKKFSKEKMVRLLSFADTKYAKTLARLEKQATDFQEFTHIKMCSENDLDKSFLEKHGDFIAKNPRGYGYWIWKTQILLQELAEMEDGEIVVYLDAGCSLNKYGKSRYRQYLDMVINSPSGILGFQMPHQPEKYWTKGSVFKHMATPKEDKESGQIMGGIFILRKCANALELIKEQCALKENYALIDDSNCENEAGFKEHRHDQSLWSLLCKKYKVALVGEETWWPNFSQGMSFPFWATRKKF